MIETVSRPHAYNLVLEPTTDVTARLTASENSDASLPSSPGIFLRKSDISVLTMIYSWLLN